jgi:hypothetical protein
VSWYVQPFFHLRVLSSGQPASGIGIPYVPAGHRTAN